MQKGILIFLQKPGKLVCIALIAVSCFTINACTKQKYKQKTYAGPEESLVNTFIQSNPGVTISQDHASDIPYEYGVVFTSSKKGILSGIGVRMPAAGSVYTVSVWDYAVATLIKRTDISNTGNASFNYTDLEAVSQSVPIIANKKYIVSVFIKAMGQSQPWPYYYILKPSASGSAENYIPFTNGSLTCTGTQFTLTNTPAFPDQPVLHNDIMNGLCDIKFKATEK